MSTNPIANCWVKAGILPENAQTNLSKINEMPPRAIADDENVLGNNSLEESGAVGAITQAVAKAGFRIPENGSE